MPRRAATIALLVALGLAACVGRRRTHVTVRPLAASGERRWYAMSKRLGWRRQPLLRGLHYALLSIDRVYLRSLKGFSNGDSVAVGFEVDGILGGESVSTVGAVVRAGARDAISFSEPVRIGPFQFSGRDVHLTVKIRLLDDDAASNIAGRLAGVGAAALKIQPGRTAGWRVAKSLFDGVYGVLRKKDRTWRITFTLYAVRRGIRRAEATFSAGQHALVGLPKAEAPTELRERLDPHRLVAHLRVAGNQLLWTKDDKPVTETPYVILTVRRLSRSPKWVSSSLRKLLERIEILHSAGAYERAAEQLRTVPSAIREDPVLTTRERNLEQLLHDWRTARAAAALARKAGRVRGEFAHNQKQVRILRDAGVWFRDMLDPAERADFDFKIRRLLRRNDVLRRMLLSGRLGPRRRRAPAIRRPAPPAPPRTPVAPAASARP